MDDKISIQRKMEIEEDIFKYKENGRVNFVDSFKDYTMEDSIYLREAFLLPIEDISLQLSVYESMDSRINKDVLIKRLANIFNIPVDVMGERVNDVEKINKIKCKDSNKILKLTKNK